MSEFKRKRIYYTKAQIITGLVTEGKEWMFRDGTEYIGQYHRYTTNEVFSEANFVKDKSRILIPYVETVTDESDEVGINIKRNFEYDGIKTIKIKKSKTPNFAVIDKTDKDVNRGWMERYFASKVNDENILELDKEQYGKVGQDGGLDKNLWEKFKIRWKVSGPLYDLVDTKTGIIKETGIIDTNQRTINQLSEKYPHLEKVLLDLTEFST